MIRAETAEGWIIITHGEHARLAGLFAEAWGNAQFAPPEPAPAAVAAVYCHDDGWAGRDAAPFLTKTGIPEAFTRDLVGAYSAFEEIDLPNYLRVRGEATAAVAAKNLHAAIIVSMHTVNLLTEQADLATLRPEHRPLHAAFVEEQRTFQRETAAKLGLSQDSLEHAFRFLQCCDNLSLIACSAYPAERALRHTHPDRTGKLHTLLCRPAGNGVFIVSPSPFREPVLRCTLHYRQLHGKTFPSHEAYREALAAAPFLEQAIEIRSA